MPTSAPVIWSIDLRVASFGESPSSLHHALDVFHHHDGVVHQQADGQHQAEHGERVDRVSERPPARRTCRAARPARRSSGSAWRASSAGTGTSRGTRARWLRAASSRLPSIEMRTKGVVSIRVDRFHARREKRCRVPRPSFSPRPRFRARWRPSRAGWPCRSPACRCSARAWCSSRCRVRRARRRAGARASRPC